MTILVTGAAGFIGSNFVLNWLSQFDESLVAIDKLTYAGNLENLASVKNNPNYTFIKADIGDSKLIAKTLKIHQPSAIINFAAESHVDRSISGPSDFMQTNVIGTFRLLEEVRFFFENLNENKKNKFKFLHISTDEVYGTLNIDDPAFTEINRYKPNSPYSASKAASDHLVRAWNHTYNLPVLTTNCSNNYGPYQFPEKLIPLCIIKALEGENLPLYGDGKQVRDWLYVNDHCNGILKVLEKGSIGETYNIGGMTEKTNIDVVTTICDILDQLRPRVDEKSYKEQITFIQDRQGHDRRYAIDITKITNEIGWKPEEKFESGIRKTIEGYLNNQEWITHIQSGKYKNLQKKNYR